MQKNKVYNILQAAEILEVHERTVRYWIRKGWVKPKRDHRNYPVFTEDCLTRIKEWHETLKD